MKAWRAFTRSAGERMGQVVWRLSGAIADRRRITVENRNLEIGCARIIWAEVVFAPATNHGQNHQNCVGNPLEQFHDQYLPRSEINKAPDPPNPGVNPNPVVPPVAFVIPALNDVLPPGNA